MECVKRMNNRAWMNRTEQNRTEQNRTEAKGFKLLRKRRNECMVAAIKPYTAATKKKTLYTFSFSRVL